MERPRSAIASRRRQSIIGNSRLFSRTASPPPSRHNRSLQVRPPSVDIDPRSNRLRSITAGLAEEAPTARSASPLVPRRSVVLDLPALRPVSVTVKTPSDTDDGQKPTPLVILPVTTIEDTTRLADQERALPPVQIVQPTPKRPVAPWRARPIPSPSPPPITASTSTDLGNVSSTEHVDVDWSMNIRQLDAATAEALALHRLDETTADALAYVIDRESLSPRFDTQAPQPKSDPTKHGSAAWMAQFAAIHSE